MALFNVNLDGIEPVNLLKGHSDIVRCSYYDPKTGMFVSGGEDGKVCVFSQ